MQAIGRRLAIRCSGATSASIGCEAEKREIGRHLYDEKTMNEVAYEYTDGLNILTL